ncbi:MAG TPA: HgcAB-associated protein [Candidatus Deferrimicrobiaceae bacterium]|nr:HgcAB-associated protein [Candidatus Deferrimicrobiaceae bacterium]
MRKTQKEDSCCPTAGIGGCKVESLVSVDERGQLVLPKEIRDRAGIKGGDKLAVVSWEKDGKVCCLSLIRVEEFTGMVRELLGPLMGEVLNKR